MFTILIALLTKSEQMDTVTVCVVCCVGAERGWSGGKVRYLLVWFAGVGGKALLRNSNGSSGDE